MHSRTGHAQRVTTDTLTASSFRAADAIRSMLRLVRLASRERDLLRYSADTLLMKKLTLLGALALFATSIGAQSPVTDDPKMVEALLKEVQAQQLVIADNQAKIDAKLATVAEAIRVARIYGSRGGR